MVITWHVLFWPLQILAWLFIPLLQSYVVSGEFTFIRKLIASVIENVRVAKLCLCLRLLSIAFNFQKFFFLSFFLAYIVHSTVCSIGCSRFRIWYLFPGAEISLWQYQY